MPEGVTATIPEGGEPPAEEVGLNATLAQMEGVVATDVFFMQGT